MVTMTKLSDQALINRRKEILAAAHLAMATRRADELKQIETLADKLKKPGALDSPPPELSKHIHWTDSELDALYAGVKILREQATFIKWEGTEISDASKLGAATMITKAVMQRFLPKHRHRNMAGLSEIPKWRHEQFYGVFGLRPNYATKAVEIATPATVEAAASATPAVQPQKERHWDDMEKKRFLSHLCHILRKQGLREVPQTSDHVGCIIFGDAVRAAQTSSMPRHRYLNLEFARRAVMDMGLMPHLEPMLKLSQLPAMPPKPPELEELMALATPKPHSNSNGHHAPNGTTHEPANRLFPEPPKIIEQKATEPDLLAAFSDAQLFQAAVLRALSLAGRMEAVEKLAKETNEYCELLTEENGKLVERAESLKSRVEELEGKMLSLSVEAERVRVPRVAILGCRKDLFDLLAQEVTDHGLKLELIHYEQEQSKVMPVHADYAICMPGLSHAQEGKAKESVPPGNYFFLSKFSNSRAIAVLKMWFQPELVSGS